MPLAVQAVTAADLSKNQIRRLEDVASIVPGLNLTRSNGTAAGTSTVRGVSFDSNASGSFTTIEFYRNDATISSGILFQSLYDIGQIEVLRGPQGTLRGRASPSGSFTITTRRPDMDEFGGYVSGTLANDDRRNVNGAINVPILRDVLAVRLAGAITRDRGTDISGLNLFTRVVDDNLYDRTDAFRVSARLTPMDDILTLDFNYERIERQQRFYDQVKSRGLVEGNALNGPVTITSKDMLGIGALASTVAMPIDILNWQAQLKLVGQRFTYVGAWQKQLNTTLLTKGNNPADQAGVLANPSAGFNGGPASPWLQETNTTNIQETHEFRLQNDERVAGLFDYVVGYMLITGNSPTLLYSGTASGSAAGLTNLRFGGALRFRTDKESSFFGNITAHLGDRIEVSGGLRQINFTRDSGLTSAPGTSNRDPNISSWPAAAAFAANDKLSTTIYAASAKYKITDDVMAYFNFGTSFRPGNIVICTVCLAFPQAASARQLSFLRLGHETSKGFEIGFKTSWLDRRLKLNVAAFHQKFTNFPVRSATAVQSLGSYTPGVGGAPATGTIGGAFAFVATNPATVKGVEAEVAFEPNENLSISANIAFADGKISNGVFPCVDLNNDNAQDATPITGANLQAFVDQVGADRIDTCRLNAAASAAPKWSGSMQAEYRHDFADNLKGYLRGLVSWRGSTVGETLNPFDSVKAYALLNVFAGVRGDDDAWEIGAYVKNLANTHRVLTREGTRLSTTISNVSFPNDYYNVTTNVPREFGISARFAFGSR